MVPGVVTLRATRANLEEELYPAELQYISRAVSKRVLEFRTARGLAREALAELGVARPPMIPGHRGEPSWPDGIVGALTHCPGFCAVAVARSRSVVGLGIDAEPNVPLFAGALRRITSDRERERVDALVSLDESVSWDRLLFSAKESVFKLWFPIERTMLDFGDAEVTLHPEGTFTVAMSPFALREAEQATIPSTMTGRWLLEKDVLKTSITVTCAPSPTTSFGRDARQRVPAELGCR